MATRSVQRTVPEAESVRNFFNEESISDSVIEHGDLHHMALVKERLGYYRMLLSFRLDDQLENSASRDMNALKRRAFINALREEREDPRFNLDSTKKS